MMRSKASRNSQQHVICRRLWPSDRAAVRGHFLRLDPETRANRFMNAVSDAVASAYADRAIRNEGLMFGCFVDGELRALGELRPAGPRDGCALTLGARAEAAFAVEREFRRNGLGSRLFRRIVEAARSRGVGELQVRCLHRNGAMHRLALKLGARLHPHGFETEGAIQLPRATPLSLWSEGLCEAIDLTMAFAAAAVQTASPGQATIR